MVLNVKALAVFFLTSALMSAAPQLSLSTSAIGPINTIPGVNGPNQTVNAINIGTGTLNLTATSSASWLSATVGAPGPACASNTGTCYPVTISLNTASLAAGTYTEFITLTDPNAIDSPRDISVTVNSTGVQSSITAYVTPTGGSSPTALFNVFTTGTGVTGTVATQSGGNWLQFLSGTGGILAQPAPFLIEVAAQVGQAAGTYTGTVTISGSSVASDNKTINVTMIVTSSPHHLADQHHVYYSSNRTGEWWPALCRHDSEQRRGKAR